MARATTSRQNEPKLVKWASEREASVSVGASTARGMPKGTVKISREFLKNLDLRVFVAKTEIEFQRRLNASSDDLANVLRRINRRRNWGGARKFLNIFLRGCLYNHYVREHYRLDKIERFLEVPLDKMVATRLRSELRDVDDKRHPRWRRVTLPSWPGVSHLHRDSSKEYQEFANRVAKSERIARVHLDLKYWRQDVPDG